MENVTEQILQLLEKDARLSYKELAVLTDSNEEDVKKIVTQLEQDNVICGYQALINWDKTDEQNVSAVIELKVTPNSKGGFDSIAEKIYQSPEVEAMYLMSGSYDFMVILKKAPMKSIARFVNHLAVLDEVISTATHIVLNRYKDHNVSLVNYKDYRVGGF